MEITKHFTVSVFIVYKNSVLFHLHKQLGFWLPVGGHIERDELPQEAAIRESMEETGLTISLYDASKPYTFNGSRQLISPMHLLLENINPYHQHIDFIYYATSTSNHTFSNEVAVKDIQWLTIKDIDYVNAPDNAKEFGKEALKLLKNI